ncbi:MAG: Gfo/Idh/MocA family oxidoreductase [Chloroflexi bacterium]|nr:Gfo/Idh/MocA family oxidoreductase [Chloroflexota bacterium]
MGLSLAQVLLEDRKSWSVTAIVDRSPAAYFRYVNTTGNQQTSFHKTLGDALTQSEFDAVIIATHAPSHVPVTIELIESNFSGTIFVEKPLANRLDHADTLTQLISDSSWSGILAVDYKRRCSTLYGRLFDFVQDQRYGKLVKVVYVGDIKMSMEGSHFIDIACQLTDSQPVSVSATLDSESVVDHRGAEYFDPIGELHLKYSDGLEFDIVSPSTNPQYPGGLTCIFESAVVNIDDAESRTQVSRKDAVDEVFETDKIGYGGFNWSINALNAALGLNKEFRYCTLAQSALVLEVVVGAHISHDQQGQRVNLPLSGKSRSTILKVA